MGWRSTTEEEKQSSDKLKRWQWVIERENSNVVQEEASGAESNQTIFTQSVFENLRWDPLHNAYVSANPTGHCNSRTVTH